MNVVAAAGLSVSLSAFALWKKALTPGGVILAWFLGILITASGGVAAFPFCVQHFSARLRRTARRENGQIPTA